MATNQPALLDECVILETSIQSMTQHSNLARRELDKDQLAAAIQSMSSVCQHLRTTSLAPDLYYDLYQRTTEILMEFEGYFDDIDAQNRDKLLTSPVSKAAGITSLEKLHEVVQYCADLIPRLYLTITVGSALIKTKRVPCKNILFDLTELCRGVQQPIHGLFLRSYLSLMTKDKLPDLGTQYNDPFHGDVTDAINFMLENFSQMNRLWVRMQHQGTIRDRPKREQQRRTLQQLVGANLYRLSDLQGLTYELYKEQVLPRLLDEIMSCKDVLAQEFLMDCIIQAFSDEFQIGTLELYLNAITQLQERVNVQRLLTSLLARLSRFGQSLLEGTISLRDLTDQQCGLQRLQSLFPLISSTVNEIITNHNLTLANAIQFHSGLLSYISVIHTDRLDYIDSVLKHTIDILRSRKEEYQCEHKPLNKDLLSLVSAPLEYLKLRFFELQHVAPLVQLLSNSTKRIHAAKTCQVLLAQPSTKRDDKTASDDATAPKSPQHQAVSITEVGIADAVFSLLKPLTRNDGDDDDSSQLDADQAPVQYEEDGSIKRDTGDLEAHQMEQNFTLVARVIHLISDTNIETFCKMLITARKYLGQGIPSSLSLTLPPLLARSFKLAQRVYQLEQDAEKKAAAGLEKPALPIRVKRVLHFIHETLQIFTQYDPHQGLRLYIQAALVSDQLCMEPISYEFVAQSFLTYEERISDSKSRLQALSYIMAHLPGLQNWSAENYDNIAQACYRHAGAYMIKTDQARFIANCAHLYWVVPPDVVANTDVPIETQDSEGKVNPQRHADKVMSCIRKALAIARDCSGHQTTLFLDMLNKFLFFYLQRCPSIELDHIVGLLDLIIANVEPLLEQGFGKPSSSSSTSAANTQAQQHHATLLYFKNTVQYMVQSEIIQANHQAVELITQIHRE